MNESELTDETHKDCQRTQLPDSVLINVSDTLGSKKEFSVRMSEKLEKFVTCYTCRLLSL